MAFIQNPCKEVGRININLVAMWDFLGFFTESLANYADFANLFYFAIFADYAKLILPLITFFLSQIARIYADFLYGFSSPKSIQKTGDKFSSRGSCTFLGWKMKIPPEEKMTTSGGI